MWKDNDDLKDYRKGIVESFGETIYDCALEGADLGGDIGKIFGNASESLGRAIGGVVGSAVGAVKAVGEAIGSIIFGSSSGCYITTATCLEYGKPDDCYELNTFRSFRDHWLAKEPDGQTLIRQYYASAPEIIELVNKQPNSSNIYRHLNDHYLVHCLHHIETGKYEQCKELYIEMMNYLYQEKKKWQ